MIKCQDSAIKYFIETYAPTGKVIASFNKGRHKVIQTEKERFYCVYKREFFNTFGLQFPEFEGQKGESLNQTYLDRAINSQCATIIFIHPEGAYKIYTRQFQNFATTFNLLRTQEAEFTYRFVGGVKKKVNEVTLSVPVSVLEDMARRKRIYTRDTIGELNL